MALLENGYLEKKMKINRILISLILIVVFSGILLTRARSQRFNGRYPENQRAYIVDTIDIQNPLFITDEGWDTDIISSRPSIIISYDTSVKPVEMMDSVLLASYLNDSIIYYTTTWMTPYTKPAEFFRRFYIFDRSADNAFTCGGAKLKFIKMFSYHGHPMQVYTFDEYPKFPQKYILTMINLEHIDDFPDSTYNMIYLNIPGRTTYLPFVFPADSLNRKIQ